MVTYLSYFKNMPRVYLLDIETGTQEVVGDFPGMTFAPRFSPDGKKIIMSFAKDGKSDIYTMNLENRIVEKITNHPSIDTSPSYSPDGKYIMMGDRNIRLVDINGNDLTNVEFSEEGCRPGCGGIFAYVSKDGSKIIYTRRDINPSHSVFFVNGKVEEWDYKNTAVTRKIKRKDNKLEPKNENNLPVFSPKQMECLEGLFGSERAEELSLIHISEPTRP